MSKVGLTEIACVLDRSGSMSSIIDDSIGGINTFLQEQRDSKDGEARITIAMFDDKYEELYRSVPIENVEDFTKNTYSPRGTTALLDAIGKTINTLGEVFDKKPEEEKPEKVIFVILTDGQENASKEFNHETVMNLIKEQREKWNWQFVFLSADEDGIETGHILGFSSSAHFNHNGDSARDAMNYMSSQVMSYRNSGKIDTDDKEIN